MTRCAEKLIFWGLLLQINADVSIGAAFPQKSQETNNTACTTKDNQTGICVELNQCTKLYNLVISKQIVRNRENEELFRNNDCGWNNNVPKICCSETLMSNLNTTIRQLTSNSSSALDNPIVISDSFDSLSSRLTKSKPAECGKSEKMNDLKVVGGKPAALGKWPWMVALGYRKIADPAIYFSCGASLIADEWLLTAAHCARPGNFLNLMIARLGDLDLNPKVKDNATPVDIPIKEVIVHPNYTSDRRNFDVALLKLKKPVQFTNLIKPICLYSGPKYEMDEFYQKKRPFVVGWGVTENGTAPTQLYEVAVQTHDFNRCVDKFSKIGGKLFTQNILCAGQRGKDSCQGDSGGPLIFINTEEDRCYLGGVVSAGRECGTDYPGLYMKVAKFIGWINNATGFNF